MRQRLVLRFDILYDERIREKAMMAVASYEGVKSVVLDEDDETKMLVIGEDMDAFGLVNILKKRNYKAYMESLEKIKHDKKEHHGKEKEEKKQKKIKKKKNKGRKKKHGRTDSGSGSSSGSGTSSGSSSDSESDSEKNKRGHRHNRSSSGSSSDSDSDTKQRHHRESRDRRTYIYRPEYPTRIYPTSAPYDNGYDYRYLNSRYTEVYNLDNKYPNSHYSEGYKQEGCSIM